MFDKDKIYWVVFKGDNVAKLSRKGKVVEENNFMIKLVTEHGIEYFIPLGSIISANEDKSISIKSTNTTTSFLSEGI